MVGQAFLKIDGIAAPGRPKAMYAFMRALIHRLDRIFVGGSSEPHLNSASLGVHRRFGEVISGCDHGIDPPARRACTEPPLC